MTSQRRGYQYVALRCVPRAEREEFVNVGVVLYCQAAAFLGSAGHVDEARLRALDPGLDIEAVREALTTIDWICRGDHRGGAPAATDLSSRFGFLSAPRSTVVRPGPIHGGLTRDCEAELAALVERLAR